MKSVTGLKHEFVEFVPDELEQGTLYVSIRFATATHLCCCGCGNKVVTPIRPTDWKIIFDGKTISLHPSIGNWSFPCQSHYWIRNNRVEWASKWSHEQIDRGRLYDGLAKHDYFNAAAETTKGNPACAAKAPEDKPRRGFWQALKKWFS